MKNTAIITILVLFSFGWSQNMNPSERFFSQLPQEIQDQLSQPRISWGQSPIQAHYAQRQGRRRSLW